MEDKNFGCADCKHIKGIRCNVENCYYNDHNFHCTAEEISVGPRNADSSDATLCVTFRPSAD